MKSSFTCLSSFGLLILSVSLTAGCAQNRQAIARLEQENAQQRERIWQSNRKMEDFRRENESLRQQIASMQKNPQASSHTAPSGGYTSPAGVAYTSPSIIQSDPATTVHSEAGTPPKNSTNSSTSAFPPASTLGTPAPPQELPTNPATGSFVEMKTAPRQIRVRKTDSGKVHSVLLQETKVRAIGTDGLHAEFQLRDPEGDILLAPAPLDVSVVASTSNSTPVRISHWRYTAEDVADIINSGKAGITIPLDMAWAQGYPQNENLELQILYYTSDKRVLVHRIPINLDNTSQPNSGGLILESANPAVGQNVTMSKEITRPEWSPNP